MSKPFSLRLKERFQNKWIQFGSGDFADRRYRSRNALRLFLLFLWCCSSIPFNQREERAYFTPFDSAIRLANAKHIHKMSVHISQHFIWSNSLVVVSVLFQNKMLKDSFIIFGKIKLWSRQLSFPCPWESIQCDGNGRLGRPGHKPLSLFVNK